ncbi:MAG: hypothetical protein ACFFFB_10835 [Candidatus Heimdallarchaeota archaeon]
MIDNNQFVHVLNELKALVKRRKINEIIRLFTRFQLKVIPEYKFLTDTQIYDLIGEVMNYDPILFSEKLYQGVRGTIPIEKFREMERYIMEKYSFYSGEKILHEYYGKVGYYVPRVVMGNIKFQITSAIIYITNYRIIAHGFLKAGSSYATIFGGLMGTAYSAGKMRGAIFEIRDLHKQLDSEQKSCFGYQFPHTGMMDLRLHQGGIEYCLKSDQHKKIFVNLIDEQNYGKLQDVISSIYYKTGILICKKCKTENSPTDEYCSNCHAILKK